MKIELDEYCPCCEYNTFNKEARLHYSICPICFWEDDPIQFEEPDYEGGANRVSLIQARKNFIEFGSCEKEMIKNCRKPNRTDKKKSLTNTKALFQINEKNNNLIGVVLCDEKSLDERSFMPS